MIYMELEDSDTCKIFVGNVPFQCSKEEFIECFKNYIGFIDGDIINRFNSNNSRGFGFVTFNTSNNADEFLNSRQQISLKNRYLRFTRYMPLDKKIINNKYSDKNFIFIKNVPKNYTPSDIKNIFEKYSDIGSCFVNTNINTGESKGTAVVEILDDDSYYNLLNQRQVNINDIILYISKWKQKIKIRKQNNVDIKDVYRLAFNAGRNMGLMEAIKISKYN